MTGDKRQWTVVYGDAGGFERFFRSLDEYQQAVLTAAVEHVLGPFGIDICQSEWGKNLGGGLYEFRIRRSLGTILNQYRTGSGSPQGLPAQSTVLLRVFCTFHGNRIVLLLGGYDKGRDPSAKRQSREIRRARKALEAWRRQQNH